MHFLVPQIYPLPHIYQHPNNEKRRVITNRIHLPHLSFHARSRPQLPRLHPPTFDPTIQEKREKRKKEANYVPSNPHTHPKSPFILLLIPFSDPRTISSHHHRRRFNHRRNSSADEEITAVLFLPPKYQGHRPFEFNRFSPRKKKLAAAPPVSRTRSESFPCGKRVRGGQLGRAPHLDALPVLYPVHLNRLSLFLDARADGIDISVEKRDGGRGKESKDGPWHRLRPRTNHVEWAVG